MISVQPITIAESSLDHLYPNGAILDNNSSIPLIDELEGLYPNYSILDLGTAGGQWVIDSHNRGHLSVGIEGSNTSKLHPTSKGKQNWEQFDNTVLFNSDISKDFQVFYNEDPIKFDIITSWEVLEHIDIENLDTTLA